MPPKTYPVEYSLVEVTYVDGTTAAFTISAGPSITNHLTQTLRDTGALTLRNGTDTVVILREQLRGFALRKLTQE
jgi:hypothetical protein